MNRYIQPFSRSVKFFNNKALWFNLISKNSTPCEVEDNILLSRLKLVGASLRGGSCRERQVLEKSISRGRKNRLFNTRGVKYRLDTREGIGYPI